MKVEQIVCDACGKVKGKANHWFVLGAVKELGFIQLYRSGNGVSPDPRAKVLDLCGRACVLEQVEQFMGGAVAAKMATEVEG